MFKFSTKLFIMLISFLCFNQQIKGQIVINEFSASNSSLITDPDFQENSDWIELHNSGNSTINLNGYSLTDNLKTPQKWIILTDITMDPGDFLIIWADGLDTLNLHTSFKLSADGEELGLFSPTSELIDSITFTSQETDVSYGRIQDGSSTWGFFTTPTPGSTNNSISYNGFTYHAPMFSPIGHIFNSSITVNIKNTQGGVIRYTIDGSEPTINSPIYNNPITIDTTTIIRARIFESNNIAGPTITHSYLKNENYDVRNLPIVSIATDPKNFWDAQEGIYVQDFKPEWEVPINIEIFENNGSDRAGFNEQAGTKVNGLFSWQLPQKMLGIYFRGKYGSSSLEYPILTTTDRKSYKTFALRASGNDWSNTLFRDILGQSIAKDHMNLDIQGYRPSVVYVNGQYMGIHNIREKVESDYIEENHSLEKGTFDMIENENYAEEGDLTQINEFISLRQKDLTNQANYEAVIEQMEVDNFTDYMITQIYARNTSIDHNVMAWKPKDEGKWKWIMMDLDRGFLSPTTNLIDTYLTYTVFPFKELYTNEEYKNYFLKRFADHLYTSLNANNVISKIEHHASIIEEEVPYHIERWLGTTSSYGNAMPSFEYWEEEVCKLKDYAIIRPQVLLNDLESHGLSKAFNLSLNTYPNESGNITFNGQKIIASNCTGAYPGNLPIELTAKPKVGYNFVGWASSIPTTLIAPSNAIWKYLDNGSNQGTQWKDINFDDNAWPEGAGQLGYGDGDEKTTLNSNSGITTYFRHTFNIDNHEEISSYVLKLLRDDGAVVYINGKEVLRDNISCNTITFETLATNGISGAAESDFTTYFIDKKYFQSGSNLIAVEIHQSSATSSDISFDLELIAYKSDFNNLVSTSATFTTSLTEDNSLTAVFEANGECIIPELVDEDLTLNIGCSPYKVQGDVLISKDATLSIEEGVEIWLSENSFIEVNGAIQANGSDSKRVTFKINPNNSGNSWRSLSFVNASPSSLSYVTIEDASHGPIAIRDIATISAYNSTVYMDNMIIEKNYGSPIHAKYSNITLLNSTIHSDVTGDLINVKYGKGRVENCIFHGNDQPDTDAIDYDDVENGIIRNCKIYNLLGFNSDAIDIGEQAQNILIDSVWVYNITDKGVSVGQQSSARVQNSTFINCNLGMGLKDSCQTDVDHCTFYSVVTPISCYEKNIGSAGGNARVTNSILSNSSESSYYVDNKSTLSITHSLSDTDTLPTNGSNLYGNPLFNNTSFYNFELNNGSPAIGSGNNNGFASNLGVVLTSNGFDAPIMFSHLFISATDSTFPEFIGIYNPNDSEIDISNYFIDKGITFQFPEGSSINALDTIFITNNSSHEYWNSFNKDIFEWTEGKLSNNGESIQLRSNVGIVVDYIKYKNDNLWPTELFTNQIATLIDQRFDNHFGLNWKSEPTDILTNTSSSHENNRLTIYPNPSKNIIWISSTNQNETEAFIYSTMGVLTNTIKLEKNKPTQVSVDQLSDGIYLIKVGNSIQKLLLE